MHTVIHEHPHLIKIVSRLKISVIGISLLYGLEKFGLVCLEELEFVRLFFNGICGLLLV